MTEFPKNTWIDFSNEVPPTILPLDIFITRPSPPRNCLPCFRSFAGEGAKWPSWEAEGE